MQTRRKTRHPDFQRLYDDFINIRGSIEGPGLYQRFLAEYGLDETGSYEVTSQRRLRELALSSPKHLAIKQAYPMFPKGYWDSLITGIRNVGARIRLRSDYAVKLRIKGLNGRRLNIRFGGEN